MLRCTARRRTSAPLASYTPTVRLTGKSLLTSMGSSRPSMGLKDAPAVMRSCGSPTMGCTHSTRPSHTSRPVSLTAMSCKRA